MMKSRPSLPTVVLAGRVNVGKSTLFNRLAGMHRSLVSPVAGTTRDIQDSVIAWKGCAFRLIDTGGLDVDAADREISAQVVRHAKAYCANAQLVLMVTDVHDGLLPADRAIIRDLRALHVPVRIVVNKADAPRKRQPDTDIWKLGLGAPLMLSALNGIGTGDLLDEVAAEMSRQGYAAAASNSAPPARIAIIGKPNVGKSTLVNAILGYERAVVSPHAHTTREPVDTLFTWTDPGKDGADAVPRLLLLIDTAGIRKQAKIKQGLERAGVVRSLAALARTDVAVLVVDLSEGINDQDKNLAGVIGASGAGAVIVGNKWDLVRRHNVQAKGMARRAADRGAEWSRYIAMHMPSLSWAPIMFASALNRANVQDLLAQAVRVATARESNLADEETDGFIAGFLKRHPLPRLGPKGTKAAFLEFRQTGNTPPEFTFTVRTKEKFPAMYAHALENDLRSQYDFTGTPLRINVKTVR